MGVTVTGGTMQGAMTPICNDCGVCLCWDISEQDYKQATDFWDAWICVDCNGGERMSLKTWREALSRKTTTNPAPAL